MTLCVRKVRGGKATGKLELGGGGKSKVSSAVDETRTSRLRGEQEASGHDRSRDRLPTDSRDPCDVEQQGSCLLGLALQDESSEQAESGCEPEDRVCWPEHAGDRCDRESFSPA